MIQYVFRDEPLTIKGAKKANPQKIGEALERIAEANKGKLTPKAVVAAAKAPQSVLHRHFEWSDAIAANAYRLEQARGLIRCIRIVDDSINDGAPVRAFLSANSGGVAYHHVHEVAKSRDLQLLILRQANRDLEAFSARYREFEDVCDLVRQARERVNDRITSTETHASA